jgi:predicted RNA binding protein YcfA (HicA-like mRNA interferase family)
LRAVSGKELLRILLRKGWRLVRVKGSHHHIESPTGEDRVTIPVHGSESLPIGLLRSIMKQAGLKENDF